MTSLTLTTDLTAPSLPPPALPAGYTLRAMTADDIPALGALCFAAYDPGVACEILEEAVADIRASFAGEYGELWLEASPVVVRSDEIVTSLTAVHRTPWDDVPKCSFIIELLTDRAHRRRELARMLLLTTMSTLREAGEERIALRVDAHNADARRLYAAAGFTPWKATR